MEPIKGWTMSYAEVYHSPFFLRGEPQKTHNDYMKVRTSCVVSPEEYMTILAAYHKAPSTTEVDTILRNRLQLQRP